MAQSCKHIVGIYCWVPGGGYSVQDRLFERQTDARQSVWGTDTCRMDFVRDRWVQDGLCEWQTGAEWSVWVTDKCRVLCVSNRQVQDSLCEWHAVPGSLFEEQTSAGWSIWAINRCRTVYMRDRQVQNSLCEGQRGEKMVCVLDSWRAESKIWLAGWL